MFLFMLITIAVALTVAMFATRNMLLGFPCVIFWAIAGADAYTLSTTVWDMHYILFFAGMGMSIFSIMAIFALRKSDIDAPESDRLESGKYIDEERGDGLPAESEQYIDEIPRPSRISERIRKRADDRRSGKRSWGAFR